MRRSTRDRRPVIVAVVAACAVVAGCGGGDDSTGSEAQPAPGATQFQEGNFDELPLLPGAEATNDPAVEDDVTTQSFTTSSATPVRVMEFYDRELEQDGWRVVRRPAQLGAEETHRGVWQKDDQQLVVSATELSGTDEQGDTRTTQFSLNLGPA